VAKQDDTSTDSYYAFLLYARSCIKNMHFHAYKTLGFLNFPLTLRQSLEEFYD